MPRKSSAQYSAKRRTKKKPRGRPFQPGNPWRIPPGQTLNPGGRPKLLSESYREWLAAENDQGITNAAGGAIALGKKVLKGDVSAIREMRQATEGDKFTFDLSKLTDEQLERIANGEDPRAVLGAAGAGPAGAAPPAEPGAEADP
jgi:hypothetical protein